MVEFAVSGVETYWWLPILVTFVISFFASMGGLSGAFLLLPFQVSILGFTAPAVSPTNLTYNIFSIPSGVYRYSLERRMVWPIAIIMTLGTLPGVFLGAIVRVRYLPDPTSFKLFAGLVLFYMGARLLVDLLKGKEAVKKRGQRFHVVTRSFNLKAVEYEFNDDTHSCPTMGLFGMSLLVGVVGGAYGIGGGAILAPFLVAVLRLPVHTIAGASLFSTWVTSLAGMIFYAYGAPYFAETAAAVKPDIALGALFGVGGFLGIYIGARLQKYMPTRFIKAVIMLCLLFVAGKYILGAVL